MKRDQRRDLMESEITPHKRNTPWYFTYKENFLCALTNIISYNQWNSKPEKAVIENFEKETLARFIFESNNIEREGLSLGETKKLVLYEFEKESLLKNIPSINSMHDLIDGVNIPVHLGVLAQKDLLSKVGNVDNKEIDEAIVAFVAKYENTSKDAFTVVRQYIACQEADAVVYDFVIRRLIYRFFEKKLYEGKPEIFKSHMEEFFPNQKEPTMPSLLSEDLIRKLHKTLATGLIDKSLTPAGEYRAHPIMTDYDSHYPAPEIIDNAMTNYLIKYSELEKSNLNPITLASWASTNFVLIHPFSDFNGRLSRILMNMILRTTVIPFWTSLRSNKKDRKRYLTALRHYRRGRILSIPTLISIQICSIIDDLNAVLEISGLSKMPLVDIPSSIRNLSEDSLSKLNY